MGHGYQKYLNVFENIESANISEEDKSNEIERTLKAREDAFVKLGKLWKLFTSYGISRN